MLLLLCGAALAAAAALFFYCGPHSRFRGTGVKYLTPVPLLGDMGRVVFQMLHWHDNMARIYNNIPGDRFFGVSDFLKPVIVIRDPELVKSITIKDFEYFTDRSVVVDQDVDPDFGRSLFSLKGKEWKDKRSKVTRVFSSSKMRAMALFMTEAGDNLVNKLKRGIQKSGKDFYDLDIQEVCFRYAVDVYAASACGLKINSQNAQDAKFYEMAKLMVQLKFKELMKFLGFFAFPNLMKMFNIKWFNYEATEFFKKLFMEILRDRELRDIDRPDMIGVVLQSRKENSLHKEDKASTPDDGNGESKTTSRVWSDLDYLAQALGFLVAGVESVASPIIFLVHMLALHPDVQEKLVMEINDIKKTGRKVDYDSVNEMTYLDMVISELLRLWASTFSERICSRDYNLGRPNDSATKDYIIRKGETIQIYSRAMHLDPEYFPEPRRFDPERFSRENRHKIRPGTYSPFGIGPRHCIGDRFAITEMKLMISTLLQHIEISPCDKTITDIKLSPSHMVPTAKGGHWVRVKLRK